MVELRNVFLKVAVIKKVDDEAQILLSHFNCVTPSFLITVS